jgi:hypothetical protein
MHYLVAKSFHVGVDVDGLACSLHRSKVYEWQTRGLCCLTGAVVSRRSAVGGGPLFRGAKPPFLDILLAFTKTCLFDKKLSWDGFLLEYLLPGARGACGHVPSY